MSSLPRCPKCENMVFKSGVIVAGELGHVPVIYCAKCGCIISVQSEKNSSTIIVVNPINKDQSNKP